VTKPLVYLGGPITNTEEGARVDWRETCRNRFAPEIQVISPLRQKVETVDESHELSADQRLQLMQHGRGVAARDRYDVARCDLLFMNLKNSKYVSIGSVGEIFWTDAYRKPVIVVREHGNIHTHAMLDALVGWIFSDLDEAISAARTLLIVG
jgi:hypothetical protein